MTTDLHPNVCRACPYKRHKWNDRALHIIAGQIARHYEDGSQLYCYECHPDSCRHLNCPTLWKHLLTMSGREWEKMLELHDTADWLYG